MQQRPSSLPSVSRPRVSVVIPTYRRADMLGRAVDSVLRQTYPEVEVIVVDDNDPSSPFRRETERIMSAYADDHRVTYLKHPANRRSAAARNTGFRHSSAEFIAFLDDDDVFAPRKIELQVARLASLDASWGAAYCGFVRKKAGRIVYRTAPPSHAEGNLLQPLLLLENKFQAGSTLLVRRRVLEELGGFDESYVRHQDWELLVRFFRKYRIACVPEHLVIAHLDAGSNRPDVERLIAVKQKFLSDFAADIGALPGNVRARILKRQMLAIASRCLKARRFGQAVHYVDIARSYSSLSLSEAADLTRNLLRGALPRR